jgi:hypothetical protein
MGALRWHLLLLVVIAVTRQSKPELLFAQV